MTTTLAELLKDTLENADKIDPMKVSSLIEETVRTLSDLEKRIKSKDPKEREEALKAAEDLKNAFELQTQKICEKSGIDPNKFSSFAEDMMAPKNPTKMPSIEKLNPNMKG